MWLESVKKKPKNPLLCEEWKESIEEGSHGKEGAKNLDNNADLEERWRVLFRQLRHNPTINKNSSVTDKVLENLTKTLNTTVKKRGRPRKGIKVAIKRS